MSFRSNLSPDQKMLIIVAAWLLALAATGATLYALTPPPAPPTPVAPVTVAPATVAPDAPTGESRVFTAPGAAAPAPQTAPTPQVFTVPGAAPPGAQVQSGPLSAPQNKGPRIAQNPGLGNHPLPLPQMQPPRSMNGAPMPPGATGNRPAMPTPPVNVEAQRAFEAGSAALRAGDKNQAASQFARAVQLAPDNVPSRLNLASVYLDLKQPDKAIPHLRAVATREPGNVGVQFTLARALLSQKKLDEALPYLRRTVQLAPHEREARVILAQVLFDKKQPQDAYEQWASLAQENPKDIEAQMQAAALANDVLKQPAQAQKWLRRAVSAAPREPQPALMLGQVLLRQKDAKGAASVLSKAAQNNPDNFAIYPLLADARTAAGDSKGAATALQSALAKLPTGKTDAQKQEIRATEGALRLALGRTLGASKQTKAARVEFDKAAPLLPRDPQPRALGAIAALQLGDNAGAIQGFKSALALDPKRADDRKTLAQLLAQSKNWKQAGAQFALYNQSKPGDAEALLQWAQVAGQLKDGKLQAQVLGKAVKVAPKNAAAWTQLALAQRENGDKRGALTSFEQLNKIRPNDADALYETARLQSELGDNAAALGNFKSVIEARPAATPAYPALLEAADKAGQGADARQFLVRAMAQKENVAALKQVLNFYQRKNQSAQARAFLTDLVARAPQQDAPRTALDALKGATEPTPVQPTATTITPTPTKIALAAAPTPTVEPTAKPLTSSALSSVIAPRKTLEHPATSVKTPLVATQPKP